jgi:hypothetical protein
LKKAGIDVGKEKKNAREYCDVKWKREIAAVREDEIFWTTRLTELHSWDKKNVTRRNVMLCKREEQSIEVDQEKKYWKLENA